MLVAFSISTRDDEFKIDSGVRPDSFKAVWQFMSLSADLFSEA